jgi:hypothetical protein
LRSGIGTPPDLRSQTDQSLKHRAKKWKPVLRLKRCAPDGLASLWPIGIKTRKPATHDLQRDAADAATSAREVKLTNYTRDMVSA